MESSENIDTIDVDTMLWHVGDFGTYQYMLLFLFSVINALSAFHYFGQTFISVPPLNYTCKLLPNEDPKLVTASSCFKTYHHLNTSFEQPCTSGWHYTTNYNFVSIVQQLDWVCQDDWKPAIGQSVFFVGSVIGSLSFGILADHIGRLHVLIISNMLAFLGNFMTIFSTDVFLFAISRFVAGCATDSNFVMMYIIVMEYMKPSMRTFGLNICIGIFYCISCMAVPWVAVILGTWKRFLLAIAVPHFFVIFFYFVVPESAQWLISKSKLEKAIACFERIAKINNRTLNPKVIEGLRSFVSNHITQTSHESIWGLLKTPKLRRKTCILIFKSMVMTLGYDAISKNINGFGYSPFVIFSLTSFTIFPACLFILMVQDRMGRKALASGALLTSGLFTVSSGIILLIVASSNTTSIIFLAILARLSINVAYNSGAQYAVELIPTVVRGQGVSAIHVTGYAASFFSPQILYLEYYWSAFPDMILGILLVLGAVACLFLPETSNRTLPVTLQDGENFGEDEKVFEFHCFGKNMSDSTQTLSPQNFKDKYVCQ